MVKSCLKYVYILLFSLISTSVFSQSIQCHNITRLPYTIPFPGKFCLISTMTTNMTTGNAITINADNVIIELSGYQIKNTATETTRTANGIYANNRKFITIKGGSISGFSTGIKIEGSLAKSNSHLVENIDVDSNIFTGIHIEGNNVVVRKNRIFNTGGNTTNPLARAIYMKGARARILNNEISGVSALNFQYPSADPNFPEPATRGSAYGIYIESADNSFINDNRMSDFTVDFSSESSVTGGSIAGVYIAKSTNVFAFNNMISGSPLELNTTGSSSSAIRFSTSTGKYKDNTAINFQSPYFGGTAVGSTNN